MQTRLGRPQHNASEGNVAESPLARCAQTRRASRVLSPSSPWRGGPEPQHPKPLTQPPAARGDPRLQRVPGQCVRARPRGGAPLPPSAFAGSRARRGSEPAEREGRGGRKARSGGGLGAWQEPLEARGCDPSGWNPRGLRSRVRLGAGGKPLALLSRDRGQGLGCCLVHKFLPGARPGNRFTEWGALGWFLPPGSRSSSGPVPSGSQKANVLHFLQGTCLRRRMY